jgi:hypothetical protein
MPSAQPGRPRKFSAHTLLFWWLFGCGWIALTAGCGAPGLPTPPSPPIPEAVVDLAARQAGDNVVLTFTLPGKAIDGKRLTETPGFEIYRSPVKPDGAADASSWRMVYAVPGALVKNYLADKQVQFPDPIAPEETRARPGGKVAYAVRTRVSAKVTSANSNIVTLAVYPVAEKISGLDARVTENAVELSWAAPARTSGGEPLGNFSYRVYRGQLADPVDQAALEAAAKDLLHGVKWKAKLALLASPTSTSYRDTDFEFGATYVYLVRTLVPVGGGTVESADSAPAVVTPKDIFPPAAPQGVTAAVLEENAAAPVVDLSWSINPENDVAGYRVYRSEQEGARGESLQKELLPTPAVRDSSVQPGRRYWYTVTAVDRAGNESAGSTPAAAQISTQQNP